MDYEYTIGAFDLGRFQAEVEAVVVEKSLKLIAWMIALYSCLVILLPLPLLVDDLDAVVLSHSGEALEIFAYHCDDCDEDQKMRLLAEPTVCHVCGGENIAPIPTGKVLAAIMGGTVKIRRVLV